MNDSNNYISFRFETERFWIELDSDGYALRQIIAEDDGSVEVSCIQDCLAEGNVTESIEDIDDCYIEKKEFEEVWQSQASRIRETWNTWKETLLIGDALSGKVLYHYPQGWIIAVDSNFAVLKSDENYFIGQEVSGKTVGFDEQNMWAILV